MGAIILGKLIPVLGVSTAVAGFGTALVAVAAYFLFVMRRVPTFRKHADLDGVNRQSEAV